MGIYQRWTQWAALIGFAAMAISVFSDEVEQTPAKSGVLTPGIHPIVPLTTRAKEQQAKFKSEMCDYLGKASFEARVYQDPSAKNNKLRYLLFKPVTLVASNQYPLTVFLHGGGVRSSFENLLNCASPYFAFGPARLSAPAEQSRHPAFVLVPWSDSRGWDEKNLKLIVSLIDTLRAEFPVDPRRLYVTGQSMGGYGTWHLLTQYPGLFAAGIPVCGGGEKAKAPQAKDTAIWAFHGTSDSIVPVEETRRMIDALIHAGGKPIYWEYAGAAHAETAERAYCEPGLLDWLYAQTNRVSPQRMHP